MLEQIAIACREKICGLINMFLEISGTRSRPSVSTQSQRLGGSVTPNNPDVRLVSLNGNQVVQASRDHLDRRAEVNARNIWNQGETLFQ